MAFDAILGAGYIPRTNPAVVRLNETQTLTGEVTGTFTINLSDNIAVDFFQVSATYTRTAGTGNTKPRFILKRNNVEIDRYTYDLQTATIELDIGIRTVYTFAQQRQDLFQRGDSLSLEIFQDSAPVGEINDWTVNIGLFGSFI